jgi:hypothetical protein
MLLVLLRDPIWTFISVIIAVVGLAISYLLQHGELSKPDFRALIPHYNSPEYKSSGCAGSLGYLLLLIIAWYLLYHLLLRMFFLGRSLDQNTLLVTTIIIVFCIFIFFRIFEQSRLLLLLAFHFCVITIVFSSVVISLKPGKLVYNDIDFTFIRQFTAQYISSINNVPLQLKHIPVDIIITERAAALTLFIWMYGFSLSFSSFSYIASTKGEKTFVLQLVLWLLPNRAKRKRKLSYKD